MLFKNPDLIQAEMNNGSKDYDPQYIRKHIENLTLKFSYSC